MRPELNGYGNFILLASSIYNLVMGGLTLFAHKHALKMAHTLYKLEFPKKLEAKYDISTRYLGAFGFSFGVICLASWVEGDRVFKFWIYISLMLLFLSRALIRFSLPKLFEEGFLLNKKRNYGNVIFNILLVATMILFGFSN